MPQTIQEQIDELRSNLEKVSGDIGILPDHQHNGTDSTFVQFSNIAGKKIWIPHTIYGTDAATAGNYSTFWIAPMACYVNAFKEVHAVKGTDGSAVTLMLEKLTGTTAPGSGVSVLASTIDLKGTINTVVSGTITTTIANKNLAIGDRLALLKSGTLTAVANVTVLVEIIIV